MRLLIPPMLFAVAMLGIVATAIANHIPGQPCSGCASHANWPRIDGKIRKANHRPRRLRGTRRSDQLMGHHGSDVLLGRGSSDVLWADWDGVGQPTSQSDVVYGGDGNDFIYGSHGHNEIHAGPGNDAISVHYGRGLVDCGPGRDIYHVARTRRRAYRFRNCEKVDYRPESQRGGLRPL